MRNVKNFAAAAVAAVSLVGASASWAADWDPQGTNVTGTSNNSILTDDTGHHVSCAAGSSTVNAGGFLATAITTTNPVAWFNCSNDIIGGATTVTTLGTWTLNATSTTVVDARAVNPSGPVAIIHIPLGCDISIPGPIDIPNNSWNNTTHQLTINNARSFTLNQSFSCFGLVGMTGWLSGTFTFPSSVVIT